MRQASPLDRGRQSVAQLTAILRRQVAAGVLQPGDRLPVMRDLARTYGVSIGTVRRAVLRLEQEGLLTSRWGSGCFVTQAASEPATGPQVPGVAAKPPGTPSASARKKAASVGGRSVKGSVILLMPYDGHFYDRFNLRFCELAQQRGLTPVKLAPPGLHESNDWSPLLDYFEQMRGQPPLAVIANTIPVQMGRKIEEICGARSQLVGVMMHDGPSRPHLWHRIMSQTAMLGEMAAQRLYDAGHRRVGLITNVRRIVPDKLPRSSRKQQYGHTELILALGRGLRQRGGSGMLSVFYNQQVPQPGPQPLGMEELQRMADFFRKPHPPTALIGQDFRLVAARQAWALAGLPESSLPEMLGIGNTPWAHNAGFDSYCHQPQVMAEHAAALLDAPPAPLAPARKIRVAPLLVPHAEHLGVAMHSVLP